jgi:hypothetical protein
MTAKRETTLKTCFYCGQTKDLIPGGTVHVGGLGEVQIYRCQDEDECLYRVQHPQVKEARRLTVAVA